MYIYRSVWSVCIDLSTRLKGVYLRCFLFIRSDFPPIPIVEVYICFPLFSLHISIPLSPLFAFPSSPFCSSSSSSSPPLHLQLQLCAPEQATSQSTSDQALAQYQRLRRQKSEKYFDFTFLQYLVTITTARCFEPQLTLTLTPTPGELLHRVIRFMMH